MKFSEHWLRELVDPSVDCDALCERLTMAGLEVEAVERLGDGLDGVVVGEIIDCQPHADADRLRVCKVAGGGEPLQIVCGAPNARVGLKAPLAKVGATLPNGMRIKPAKLRGIESNGMLCSASELRLDADAGGLLELPADAPVGEAFAHYFDLPDTAIELKLTPNRPDCLSMVGLARDVGALFDVKVDLPRMGEVAAAIDARRDVRLDAGADCPRYLGRIVEGVDAAAKSPPWLAERLRRAGVRPISAVVDVTQYVMLELGQPMHAYDDECLHGSVRVRRGREGETLTLLDGSEAMVDADVLVIADDRNVLGLAGIMGGMDSRVTDATRRVLLEAAHFAPAAIMGRARRFGLHTDASHRFERGVDPELPRRAMERATELLVAIADGKPGPVVEAVLPDLLPRRAAVGLRRQRLARVLGLQVADAEVERILTALGLTVERSADGWLATPPSRRFDIEIEEDLIEEVARVHGYDRIPTRAPSGELRLDSFAEARVGEERIRAQLIARGYREALCYSFVARELLATWSLDGGTVALANPLSADMAVMRTSLLPGLVQALEHNRNRQQERVRLFEMGLVFEREGDELRQLPRLAGVACGRALPESWAVDKRDVDFYDLKADVGTLLGVIGSGSALAYRPAKHPWLHPGRSAEVAIGGEMCGIVGELHPALLKSLGLDATVQVFDLDLHVFARGDVPKAVGVPRYPSLRRDIAIVVPDAVTFAQIEASLRLTLGNRLADLVVFDRYCGPNLGSDVKSLAIGLILQDESRTLMDEDADRCVAQAVAALENSCQARLRG